MEEDDKTIFGKAAMAAVTGPFFSSKHLYDQILHYSTFLLKLKVFVCE